MLPLLYKAQVIAGLVGGANPKNSVIGPVLASALSLLGGLIYLNKVAISRIIKTIKEKIDANRSEDRL